MLPASRLEVNPMSEREPTQATNPDRYGSPDLPWSRAREALTNEPRSRNVTFFLCTVGPDSKPYAAGVGALWQDGCLYFTSGPGMRKARNLATNPNCTFSVGLEGIDLVLANWRSVVAPPGITPEQRKTLSAAVENMVKSDAWKDILKQKGWDDAYLFKVLDSCSQI